MRITDHFVKFHEEEAQYFAFVEYKDAEGIKRFTTSERYGTKQEAEYALKDLLPTVRASA